MLRQTQQPLVELVEGRQNAAFPFLLFLFPLFFIRFAEIFMWLLYAILSAVFAALTSILAKICIENVNSHLATAIRTTIVLFLSWGIVFLTRAHSGISSISYRSFLFLILSGLATGASWLFFYKALQLGEVSKVIPIDKASIILSVLFAFFFLGEPLNARAVCGLVLLGAGTFLMIL